MLGRPLVPVGLVWHAGCIKTNVLDNADICARLEVGGAILKMQREIL